MKSTKERENGKTSEAENRRAKLVRRDEPTSLQEISVKPGRGRDRVPVMSLLRLREFTTSMDFQNLMRLLAVAVAKVVEMLNGSELSQECRWFYSLFCRFKRCVVCCMFGYNNDWVLNLGFTYMFFFLY